MAQIEATVRQEVEAEHGPGHIGFRAYVRLGLNKRLARLAGVPSFKEWQAAKKIKNVGAPTLRPAKCIIY